MVTRIGTRRLAAAAALASLLVLSGAWSGCSTSGESSLEIITTAGGWARGPGGDVYFAPGTFTTTQWVEINRVDLTELPDTPTGAPIGGIRLQIDGDPVFQIPATARFRLSPVQAGGGRAPVYERDGNSYDKVGDASVSSDGASAELDTAIHRTGLYVVGPVAAN